MVNAENEKRVRYFDLQLVIQPSTTRIYKPISFRWFGADLDRKISDNPYARKENFEDYNK